MTPRIVQSRGINWTLLVALIGMAVVAAALVTGRAGADSGGDHKSLHADRWYQRYSDSGSYVTWMTLSGDYHYDCSGCSTDWSAPFASARASWNNTDTTVYITNASHQSYFDVHLVVIDNGCFYLYGNNCMGSALGATFWYDEAEHACTGNADCDANHSRPNTYWYVVALVGDDAHTGQYGTAFQRQATAAHELGHAVTLAHDGIGDGECGDPPDELPKTVMDYNCLDDEHLNGPVDWDDCGLNHAYYDPNWGYSGC